jgi:GT2 family glycosyltransferase
MLVASQGINSKTYILIATKNRPEHLAKLLAGLSNMADEFSKVVIVDASDEDKEAKVFDTIKDFSSKLDISLVKSRISSLAHQKNLGLKACESATFVQILDDDVLPPKHYISDLAKVMEELDIAGISGVTQEVEIPAKPFRIFLKVFGLIANQPGQVSCSGVGTPIFPGDNSSQLHDVNWLIGCSMWNIRDIKDFQFKSEFPGSSLFEDVEFSHRVSKVARLKVSSSHVLTHFYAAEERPSQYIYWYRFSRNRIEVLNISSKHPRLTLLWGTIGLVIQITFGREKSKLSALRGLGEGAMSAIRGGKFI